MKNASATKVMSHSKMHNIVKDLSPGIDIYGRKTPNKEKQVTPKNEGFVLSRKSNDLYISGSLRKSTNLDNYEDRPSSTRVKKPVVHDYERAFMVDTGLARSPLAQGLKDNSPDEFLRHNEGHASLKEEIKNL